MINIFGLRRPRDFDGGRLGRRGVLAIAQEGRAPRAVSYS
jgi:hypothetical protein